MLETATRSDKKLVRRLIDFHDAVQEALGREKLGHTDGWVQVQAITDILESEYDLTAIKEICP